MMTLLSKVKVRSIKTPDQAAETSYRDDVGAPACLARKSTSFSGIKPHLCPRITSDYSRTHSAFIQPSTHSFHPVILSLSFASPSFHPNFSLSSHPSAQPSSSPPFSHFLPFLPPSLLNVSIHPSLLFPSFHPPTHPIILLSFPLSSHPCCLSTQSLPAYLRTPT